MTDRQRAASLDRKKALRREPRLLETLRATSGGGGQPFQIYAQSATDMSDEEEGGVAMASGRREASVDMVP